MSKAAATADAPKTESAAKEKKAKGAPRPRKWDYGISDDAKIVPLVEEANVKRDILKDWEIIGKGLTCAEFFKKGGSRHGLRVMSRRKIVKIVGTDGTEYPKQYVKPEKPAKEAKGDAKKSATKTTPKAAPKAVK